MPIYIYESYAPIDVQNQKEDILDKLSEALHWKLLILYFYLNFHNICIIFKFSLFAIL